MSQHFKLELDLVHRGELLQVAKGVTARFQTAHVENGLERRIADPSGSIVCHCSGTLAAVSQCLANAALLKKAVGNSFGAIGAAVTEKCGEEGLKRVIAFGGLGEIK